MELPERLEPIPVGEGELVRKAAAPGLLLAAVGSLVPTALEVAGTLAEQGVECAVVNARFIKPLDERLLLAQIGRAKAVLTLEENVLAGGLGEAVLALMAAQGLSRPARLLGVPGDFVRFGARDAQLQASGLSTGQVLESARALWGEVRGGRGVSRGKKQRTA